MFAEVGVASQSQLLESREHCALSRRGHSRETTSAGTGDCLPPAEGQLMKLEGVSSPTEPWLLLKHKLQNTAERPSTCVVGKACGVRQGPRAATQGYTVGWRSLNPGRMAMLEIVATATSEGLGDRNKKARQVPYEKTALPQAASFPRGRTRVRNE